MRVCWLVLVSTISIFAFPSPGLSQVSKKSPSASSKNVQSGTLDSADLTAATITLKPKSGESITYRLTDKTTVMRAKKSVQSDAFKAGDAVVVRYRKSSLGPATLYELADKISWDWLTRLRHDTVSVKVKDIADDAITVTEGADAAEFTYRVTEKTAWSKKGKAAAPADFKVGDTVVISPRSLPSGGVMALAITDTAEDAAKLKERSRSVVSGVIKVWNADKKTMTLSTLAGDNREFTLSAECVIRQGGKDVKTAVLKPGLHVTVHIQKSSVGEEEVRQITITTGKSTKKPTLKPKPLLN